MKNPKFSCGQKVYVIPYGTTGRVFRSCPVLGTHAYYLALDDNDIHPHSDLERRAQRISLTEEEREIAFRVGYHPKDDEQFLVYIYLVAEITDRKGSHYAPGIFNSLVFHAYAEATVQTARQPSPDPVPTGDDIIALATKAAQAQDVFERREAIINTIAGLFRFAHEAHSCVDVCYEKGTEERDLQDSRVEAYFRAMLNQDTKEGDQHETDSTT